MSIKDLPYSQDTSILNTPYSIRGKTIPNRLVCQAMEGCDGRADGSPDELTERRYLRFARGGAGLIWFEATATLPEGRANPRQLAIREDNLDRFKALIERIKETALRECGYEPLVIMQATHSGRYSKPTGTPAPLIAYHHPVFEAEKPLSDDRILSDEDLDRVGEHLVKGAILAARAGFDGVDIKSCHGYLLCELLSAFTRPGRYGGEYENRTRLYREAVKGAIAACPSDFMVSSRLGVYDGFAYPYGFGMAKDGSLTPDLTEPIRLVRELRSWGMPLLNITMGNPYQNPHVNRPYRKGGYMAPEEPMVGVRRMLDGIATLQKEVPDLPLVSSALSYLGADAPHVAAAYIQNGAFTFAGFGRQSFAYPDFARDILTTGKMDPKKCCTTCSLCTAVMRAGGTTGCVVRDSQVYGPIWRAYCKEDHT